MNDDLSSADTAAEHTEPGSPRRSWRLPVTIAAVLGASALTIGAIFAAGAGESRETTADSASPRPAATPDATASPSPTPTPTPTPSPSPDAVPAEGQLTPDVAAQAVQSLLGAVATQATDPTTAVDALSVHATGAILAEIGADTDELKANGWTRVGTAKVDGVRVLELNEAATPKTATVEACVDSTDVRLLDMAGEAIGVPNATPRSLNIYSLVSDGDTWRVTARTFAANPAC